jgi:hypothetical protein
MGRMVAVHRFSRCLGNHHNCTVNSLIQQWYIDHGKPRKRDRSHEVLRDEHRSSERASTGDPELLQVEHHQTAERDFWTRQLRAARGLNWITGIAAVTGIIGLFFIALSLRVTKNAADDGAIAANAARDQAAATVEANRPWIKPTITAKYIDIGENAIQVTVLIDNKNIGKSPAEDLLVSIKIVPTDLFESLSMQREICDRATTEYSTTINTIGAVGTGSVVFPNDANHIYMTSSVELETIRAARRIMLHGTFGDSDQYTTFTAAGCVLYRFTGSSKIHRTGVVVDCGNNYSNGVADIDIREKRRRSEPGVLCKPPFISGVITSAD